MSPRHLLLLAVLAGLAAPVAAHADVQTLSASGKAISPVTAFAADGSARVAWTEGIVAGGNVSSAPLAPGATVFGPAAPAVTGTRFESFPTAAFDGSGRLQVVALRKHKPYPRARYTAQRPDGTFTPPVTISPSGHSAGIPTIAVAADGSAIAAWRWYDGTKWVMQAAWHAAGAPFGAPIALDAAGAEGNSGFTPSVAISPGGHMLVAWETTRQLYVATGTTATQLGPAQLLGTFRPNYAPLAAAIGDDGRAVVVWEDIAYSGQGGGPTVGRVALAGSDGAFATATPVTLPSGTPGGDDPPAAAIAADGTALIVIPVSVAANRGALYGAVAPSGSGLSAPVKLADTGTYAVGPSLATGADGSALLVYTADHDGPGGKGVVSVVNVIHRPANGAWGTPTAISPTDQEALDPVAALGPGGRAVVAWTQSLGGGGEGSLDAAVLSP